ncbi:MAG: DUF378 domain-containing protein [Clostridiaceae bacterium]|nr:DUF378 domain-containing protein [Clostridiaceae bacterium]
MRSPIDRIALLLVIIGALNWLLIGLFQYDLVAGIFGVATLGTRIVYSLVGLAGLYCISLLFRDVPVVD